MLRIRMLIALLLLVLAPMAQAKDVSAQQAAYNNALQKAERAETEYKTDAQAVSDTEKVIEKKRKQLAEEQQKAAISRKNYEDAKASLEQAQTALDKAWKN